MGCKKSIWSIQEEVCNKVNVKNTHTESRDDYYLRYTFGKVNFSTPMDSRLLSIEGANETMVRVLEMLNGLYGLKGKNVADIGGSNITSKMADHYLMNKLVCIDPVSQWLSDIGENMGDKGYSNIVKTQDFMGAWENLDYFIVDEVAENLDESYHNKFDVIVSFSAFEHVDSINKVMDNIYAMLKPGGIVYSIFKPVFSSAKGHHMFIDWGLWFEHLPELDFFHLKYDREEARTFVEQIPRLRKYADEVIEKAYESHVINRKMIKTVIDEIFSSRFNQYAIDYWDLDKVAEEDCLMLEKRHGKMRYDVCGIAVTAFK